jgi:hypothetical protein
MKPTALLASAVVAALCATPDDAYRYARGEARRPIWYVPRT